MTRHVLLDAGVIGQLCLSRTMPGIAECFEWFSRLEASDTVIVVPEIAHFEVRRELVRLDARVKLGRLQKLLDSVLVTPVTSEAWLQAAEFWAIVRRAGKPTADPHALDGDAILAGVAATIGGPDDRVTIATTNVRHLSWFPGLTPVDGRRSLDPLGRPCRLNPNIQPSSASA